MANQVYNKEAARAYGVEASALLTHIYYSVREHRKHGRHLHDGRYWLYNSVASWHLEFPSISEKRIRGILKMLKDEGLILTGRYNRSACDRTLWYTVTDVGEAIFTHGVVPTKACDKDDPDIPECTDAASGPDVQENAHEAAIESGHAGETKLTNGTFSSGTEGRPIPNNTPNNTTNNSTNIPLISGAASQAEENAFDFSLPLRENERRSFTAAEYRNWQRLYPGVDIEAELRKMSGWLQSRPHRRYDRRGIDPFIHKWLSRSLEQVRSRQQTCGIFYADEDSVFG